MQPFKMNLKFLLLCGLAIIATVQIADATPLPSIPTERNLEEEFQKWLQILEDIIETVVGESFNMIWQVYEILMGHILEHVEIIEGDIMGMLVEVIKEIIELEKLAQEISEQAHQCVLDENEKINEIAITAANALKECVSNSQANAMEIVKLAEEKINDVKNILVNYLEDFEKCEGNEDCILEVISHIKETVIEIQDIVNKFVEEAAVLMENELSVLFACNNALLQNLDDDLAVLLKDIRICIAPAAKIIL